MSSYQVDNVYEGSANPTTRSTSASSSKVTAAYKTIKAHRRNCSVAGCKNGVVQGGVCVSHGAKRRLCRFPGCTKNSKNAGLCSKHGPPRKKCENEGCTNVAVRGGKCKSHGAWSKVCTVKDCTKVAALGGMCKRHHFISENGDEDEEVGLAQVIPQPKSAGTRSKSEGGENMPPVPSINAPVPSLDGPGLGGPDASYAPTMPNVALRAHGSYPGVNQHSGLPNLNYPSGAYPQSQSHHPLPYNNNNYTMPPNNYYHGAGPNHHYNPYMNMGLEDPNSSSSPAALMLGLGQLNKPSSQKHGHGSSNYYS